MQRIFFSTKLQKIIEVKGMLYWMLYRCYSVLWFSAVFFYLLLSRHTKGMVQSWFSPWENQDIKKKKKNPLHLLASNEAALFLEIISAMDWESVCRQMWIHALLQTDVATQWALRGSYEHAVNTVDYWPKWISPVWPKWLHSLWPGQACMCLWKTMWATGGEKLLLLLHRPS